DLVHRPFLVPASAVTSGIPWHAASFPYALTKAYYYLGLGWLYQLLLSPPGRPMIDTFQFEFLVKVSNVVFALADGLLMYLILRRIGVRSNQVAGALIVFLFNPALWFIMSVWGSTETVSLF